MERLLNKTNVNGCLIAGKHAFITNLKVSPVKTITA